MTPARFGPLQSRPTPKQARALRRVHQILAATAELLAEGAPEDVTTTLIAARAGVPVSSIYRYFASVEEVLRELYLQTAGELRAGLLAIFDDEAAHPGWRARLAASLAMQRDYLARHPYYRALLMRFLVHRTAIAVADEGHDELVSFLRARWARGGDGFSGGDPAVVADTVVQIALAMEDLIAAQPDRAAQRPYAAELSAVLEGYLAQYLSD